MVHSARRHVSLLCTIHLFTLVNGIIDQDYCMCSNRLMDCSSISRPAFAQPFIQCDPCCFEETTDYFHPYLDAESMIRYHDLDINGTKISRRYSTQDGISSTTIPWYLEDEILNIEFNNLHEIHSISRLYYLLASHNSLGSNPHDFLLGTCYLRKLMILNNSLSTLDSVMKCNSLEYLDASMNNIATIPETMKNLTRLTHLLLSNNSISDSGVQVQLPASLKVLDLSFNNLTACPTFEGLTNLQILILSHNKIATIDMPMSLVSLEHLNLSHNLIANLNLTQGDSIKNLRELDVSHNELIEIPIVECNVSNSFRLLNISNNKISDPKIYSLINDEMCRFHLINRVIDLRGNSFQQNDVTLESWEIRWSLNVTCLDGGCACMKIARPLLFSILYLCIEDNSTANATEGFSITEDNFLECDCTNMFVILLLMAVALLLAVIIVWYLMLSLIDKQGTAVQGIEVRLLPPPKRIRKNPVLQTLPRMSGSRSLDWT